MNTKHQNQVQKRQGPRAIIGKGILAFIFVSFLLSNNYAFANTSASFKVRQEKLNLNGVLVSRPSNEDVEIVKFLKDNNIHNPQEYAQWLAQNVQFKKDQDSDQWSNPLETLARKFGDCEDFTFLNIAVLRVMGYDAKFVAFFNPDVQNHAVTVFQDHGQFYYFDNMNLKKIEESSVLEFAKNKMSKNRYLLSKVLNVDSRKWELLYKTS